MTLNLDEISERAEKATPGPWNGYDWPGFPRADEAGGCVRIESKTTITAFCFSGEPNHDALFIAHARQDIPALVAFARDAKQALRLVAIDDSINKTMREIAQDCLSTYFGETQGIGEK